MNTQGNYAQDSATRGGDSRTDPQNMNPGASSSGGENQGRVDNASFPTYLGMPHQNFQQQQPFPYPQVGQMNQPTSQGQPTAMGGFFPPSMAFQQMPMMQPYMGYPQQPWYPQQQMPQSVPQATRHTESEKMDVDDQNRPPVPNPSAQVPRGESSARHVAPYADDRQASSASASKRPFANDGLLSSLLDRLESAGVHREFCDFLDDGMAQLVVTQLLDSYDGVRAELDRVKAREGVMAEQLSLARKRPAVASPDRGEGPSSRPIKMQQTEARREERTSYDSRRSEYPTRYSDYESRPEVRPAPRRTEMEPRRYERRPEFEPRRYDRRPEYDVRREDRPLDYGSRLDERREEFGAREVRPLPAREIERSASSSSVHTAPSPQDARGSLPPLPPPGESRVRNPERGALHKEPLGRYKMPAPAPAPPVVLVQPKTPPPSPPKASTSTESTSKDPYAEDTDDGRSTEEEKPPTAKQVAGQQKHRENNARKKEKEATGRIPEELGVVFINNRHERDNRFWDMLGRAFYTSPTQNRVFTLESAVQAAEFELGTGKEWRPPGGRLYAVAPRGFPMNPREVDQLYKLINERSHRVTDQERAEGYMLFREFRRVSRAVAAHLRDRAMVRVLADEFRNIPRPFDPRDSIWRTPQVRRPGNAFEYKPDRPTRGAGLPQPGPAHAFDVEHWCRHMIHHGRLGSKNQYGGIVMDYRFRVHRRGIWGYLLANMLAPVAHGLRSWFMRAFATILARPYYYPEAVVAYNEAHPDRPFQPISGDEVTIPRLQVHATDGRVTEAGVLQHLIESGIPIDWINHGYTYGLHYLDHYYANAGPHRDLLRNVDNDRITRLDRWGVPAAIRQWDGWYHPTTDDITRIQTLMHVEFQTDSLDCLSSPDWMLVGEDPHFRELRVRRAISPPPGLPTPALSGPTSSNVGVAPPAAPTTAPATSTTVAAATMSAAETIVDPVAALTGPLSLAAITASQGPADPNPVDRDTEMESIAGETPHSPVRDPADASMTP